MTIFIFINSPLPGYTNDAPQINRFAWHGTLDVIGFMPLSSADPFSGVIITDWYSIEQNERYKLNVYITQAKLDATTVKVNVFKQSYISGRWQDARVSNEVIQQITFSILNRARELRIDYLRSQQ